MKALEIYVGQAARRHIQSQGLSANDVSVIPGAAGGPKGLILQGLDHYLFGEFFNSEHLAARTSPLALIGASIGAWRLAAACARNPLEGLKRLADQYCEAQRYRKGVTVPEITEICDGMVRALLDTQAEAMCRATGKQLMVWVNRGKKPLYHARKNQASKRGFVAATLANGLNRDRLKHYFERWVFTNGRIPEWLSQPYDGLGSRFESLTPDNLHASLLSSASIPFVLDAVPLIPNPKGDDFLGPFWDGGLTDYHLALPYHRVSGLVLYPHFVPKVTPGWLNKFYKKRKANPEWMSNVILLCPSAKFVSQLPAQKIPDRSDFKRYGTDHDARIAHWRAAIAQSHQLADEFAAWANKPDLSQVKSF